MVRSRITLSEIVFVPLEEKIPFIFPVIGDGYAFVVALVRLAIVSALIVILPVPVL